MTLPQNILFYELLQARYRDLDAQTQARKKADAYIVEFVEKNYATLLGIFKEKDFSLNELSPEELPLIVYSKTKELIKDLDHPIHFHTIVSDREADNDNLVLGPEVLEKNKERVKQSPAARLGWIELRPEHDHIVSVTPAGREVYENSRLALGL